MERKQMIGAGLLAGVAVVLGLTSMVSSKPAPPPTPRVMIQSPNQTNSVEWQAFKCELRGKSVVYIPQVKDVSFVERVNGQGKWRLTTPEETGRMITVPQGSVCGYVRS